MPVHSLKAALAAGRLSHPYGSSHPRVPSNLQAKVIDGAMGLGGTRTPLPAGLVKAPAAIGATGPDAAASLASQDNTPRMAIPPADAVIRGF